MIASMSAQPYFDAVTLAQAVAIFNAYSVVVVAGAGRLFRISPQACRAMALGHALRLVTVLVGPLLLAAPVLKRPGRFCVAQHRQHAGLVIAWQRIPQVRRGAAALGRRGPGGRGGAGIGHRGPGRWRAWRPASVWSS